MTIPDPFVEGVIRAYGAAGREWLSGVATTLTDLQAEWGISVGPAFDRLTNNFVAFAEGPERQGYILKMGIGGPEIEREAMALATYGGHGCARLVRHDPSRSAMLLERIVPGSDLLDVPEPLATIVAADVLSRLWQATPSPGLAELPIWTASLERFAKAPGPLPQPLIEEALIRRNELLEDPPDRVVPHGDLHHTNILFSEARGWLAIDPKGLVGEKAFDIAFFLLNPGPVPIETTRKRIDTFVDRLALDKERLVGWAFVQAVLSACWTVEDNGDWWDGAIRFAGEIKSLSSKVPKSLTI